MIKIATVASLWLCASVGALARAQAPAPQAYSLKYGDTARSITVVRDGARERFEAKLGPSLVTSLYDFAEHRVYWIGWSGAGSCSSGRYLSARAPVGEDPVTGTADILPKLAEGRTRKAAGTGKVAGLAARVEAFVGGKRPAGPYAGPWPTKVWLAEQGGYLLKLEADGKDGKPVTLLEVTQLTFEKPTGAALEPPKECLATSSEMDDTGMIRGSAAVSATTQVGGSAELGTPQPRPAGALAKIDGLSLAVAPEPDDGPCGTKLRLTATLSVDGAATIKYSFRPSVGGLKFPSGDGGTVTLDAAGSTTLAAEALLPRSLKGTLRLQAMVQGTNGHNGRLEASEPVPFEVKCK